MMNTATIWIIPIQIEPLSSLIHLVGMFRHCIAAAAQVCCVSYKRKIQNQTKHRPIAHEETLGRYS